MRIESDGHSRGNPRLYELIENAPKEGKSPTVWAWPQLIDYLKVAGQPVAGPWPPHQEPRPDPEEDTLPVAVADPENSPQRSPLRPACLRPERRHPAGSRTPTAGLSQAGTNAARRLNHHPASGATMPSGQDTGGPHVPVSVPLRGTALPR